MQWMGTGLRSGSRLAADHLVAPFTETTDCDRAPNPQCSMGPADAER